MDPLTLELRVLVDTFRQSVALAVRKAALAAMSEALSDGAPKSPAPPAAKQRSRLQRRDASDIDAVKGRLLAAIASRPGLRFEQLRLLLKLERRELVLPLRKLISERKVKMIGVKRAAAYFPTKRMTTRMTSRTRRSRKKRRR